MNNNHEIFKEADFLSRLLTSNPYTAEGKSILKGLNVNLTTNDFFEDELYAEPFFIDKQTTTTNSVNYVEDDEDDVLDKEDYIFVCDDNSYFKNSMIESYEKFKSSFNNLHELPLLFIRGGSGTGKSTYMYSLIHNFKKNNPNVYHTELTLEKYTERPLYYGISLPITSDSTISRFIRVVFTKIFSLINEEIKTAKKLGDYDRINNAVISYEKSFSICPSENPARKSVFKAFGNLEYQKLDFVEYNQKVTEECVKILSDPSGKIILANLMVLLIELCYLLYPSTFYLISVDGIEYLINRTYHIYDSDINEIILAFEDIKLYAENLFEECELNFAEIFKIVVAIRNTTLNCCNKRMQENIRDSNISVDVSSWYRIEDIYKARINYFSTHNYIHEEDINNISAIVDIIIKDSKKGKKRASGAMDMLERMYNFDKRSLQSNLLTAVSQIVLSSEGGILKNKFIELYDAMGPMVYNTSSQGHRFRYLCRRAIIRILLNQIEMENRGTFFDGIYFSEYGNECKQSSYMRKMLIFFNA